MSRRRLVVWVVIFAVVALAELVLAPILAARDPIAEVLLGRGGAMLPLAGATLVLRLLLIVVIPPLLASALVRFLFDELAARRRRR